MNNSETLAPLPKRQRTAALHDLAEHCGPVTRLPRYSWRSQRLSGLGVPRSSAAFAFVLAAAVLSVIGGGCSKSGPSKNISSSAFDSAPAEVKQQWTDAMAAWKNHRYPDSAKNFVSLQTASTNLSTQQKDELTKAIDEFGQEAFTKANHGDAEATKAVQALNSVSRRSGGR